jgi:hypothetical protein
VTEHLRLGTVRMVRNPSLRDRPNAFADGRHTAYLRTSFEKRLFGLF